MYIIQSKYTRSGSRNEEKMENSKDEENTLSLTLFANEDPLIQPKDEQKS